MQTDLEETKDQEIAKLQDMLHVIQLRVEETKSMLNEEREAAQTSVKEASAVIKETVVFVPDKESFDSLTNEIEKLKV